MNKEDKIDKYRKITAWAWRRYANPGTSGMDVIVGIGGTDAPYTRIEKLAWERYMM